MRVALSKEWRKTALIGTLIPIALAILRGTISDRKDMLGMAIFLLVYTIVVICLPANLYSLIIIDADTISSKIHFIKQCEVNCLRPVQYMFFSEEIKGISDEKPYVLITNLQICFPIKRPYIDHFNKKEQIIIPYTKKTSQVLEKWFSCEHWTCVRGEKPDLDTPLPSTRTSKKSADRRTKKFRNRG